MLDQLDTPELLTLLACCRDELQLPPELEFQLLQSGFAPSRERDRRKYPRLRMNQRLPLQVVATLPALPRSAEWFAARLTQISRGGLALLHSEQLFPQEQVRVALQNGSLRQAEVAWCQRIASRCYQVGCRFAAQAAPT